MNLNRSLCSAFGLAFALSFAALAAASETPPADLLAKAKLSRADAQKIALAKVPGGKVHSAELEQEKGALVWSFDIKQSHSKNIREVLVNAMDGSIVATETETPKMQAKEAAEERAEDKAKAKKP